MEDTEVKKLVNKIFAMKGMPKVTNFAQEFSDGGKSTTQSANIGLTLVSVCRAIPIDVQHSLRGEHQLQDRQVGPR